MGIGSARFVVVMWLGLVFRVGKRSKSTRPVIVMWPVGLVWIVDCCFHVTLEVVVGPKW